MKVSTSLFFDRSTNQMIKGQSELAKTQTRLSSGKEVVNPIITNLGVFEVNKEIKIIELADNVTKEEVIEKTGTEVKFPN